MKQISYKLIIINRTTGNVFSTPKTFTPKMINAMKEQALKYTELYKEEFVVKKCMLVANKNKSCGYSIKVV